MYYSKNSLMHVLKDAGYDIGTLNTVGLGLDEFLYASGRNAESTYSIPSDASQDGLRKRVKHLLRDGFLSLGLGENLTAIARPSTTCCVASS